jgi:hypothetical protein
MASESFSGVNLTGVNLTGVNLTGVNAHLQRLERKIDVMCDLLVEYISMSHSSGSSGSTGAILKKVPTATNNSFSSTDETLTATGKAKRSKATKNSQDVIVDAIVESTIFNAEKAEDILDEKALEVLKLTTKTTKLGPEDVRFNRAVEDQPYDFYQEFSDETIKNVFLNNKIDKITKISANNKLNLCKWLYSHFQSIRDEFFVECSARLNKEDLFGEIESAVYGENAGKIRDKKYMFVSELLKAEFNEVCRKFKDQKQFEPILDKLKNKYMNAVVGCLER